MLTADRGKSSAGAGKGEDADLAVLQDGQMNAIGLAPQAQQGARARRQLFTAAHPSRRVDNDAGLARVRRPALLQRLLKPSHVLPHPSSRATL